MDRAPETKEGRDANARARLFGDFMLTDEAGCSLLPHGRKARALLAYLILADGQPVSRQRLMTLGWSERAEEQARASLRQAFYEARALTTGDRPLVLVDRGHARFDTDRVQRDLDLIVSAARDDDLARLAELLGHRLDALLADLNDVDPAFDEWLASERTRRREVVRTAVIEATSRALSNENARDARRLASFLADDDPLDEMAVRLLMACCHGCDDRAGVHRAFERAEAELQNDLGVAPSPETTETYHQLMAAARQGSSGDASVAATSVITNELKTAQQESVPKLVTRVLPSEPAASPQAMRRQHVMRPWMVPVAFAGAAMIGGALFWPHAASASHLIAVEALQVPESDSPAQAIRTGLSNDLARAMLSNPTRLDIGQVGDPGVNTRSAQFVLSGTAHSESDTLRASVRLNDVTDGTLLWSKDYSVAANRPDSLRQQMAANVAMVLACALDTRHDSGHPPDTATIRLYLGACDSIDDYDLDTVLPLLRQVTKADPEFSRGWSNLATTEALKVEYSSPQEQAPAFRTAVADARRALALDPHDGLAYYAIANTEPGIGNWLRREAVVDAGLHVDPDNSELNDTRSYDLIGVGRIAEGLAALHRLVQLDPLMPVKTEALIHGLAFNGQLDEANALIRKAISFWPNNAMIWSARFDAATRVGDPLQAETMLRDPGRPDFIDNKDVQYWTPFLRARAAPTPANIDAAIRSIDRGDGDGPNPFFAAGNLADLKQVDLAHRLLEHVPLGDVGEDQILFRSYMERFRADPRFMALALRRGLVTIWRKTGHWPDFCSTPHPPYDCVAEARLAEASMAAASSLNRQNRV